MKLRGASLAAGLFLLALSLWGQPAEAAVSPSFYPSLLRSHQSSHSQAEITFLSLYLPFSSALAREFQSALTCLGSNIIYNAGNSSLLQPRREVYV